MKITVAGEQKEVKDGITVSELIELEKVETPEYVTVSVNEEFVESGSFASTVLKEGDEVEFLYFMGGGSITANAVIGNGAAEMPLNEVKGRFLMKGGSYGFYQ